VRVLTAFQQFVPTFLTEVGKIDGGNGICCENLDDTPGRGLAQELLRAQDRQRASETRHIKQELRNFTHIASVGWLRLRGV